MSGVTYDIVVETFENDEFSKFGLDVLIEKLRLYGILPVTTEGNVYFIKSEKTHAIKIGFTSGQIEKRLSSLQTANADKLQLLATIPGTQSYEKALHEQFANYRLKGEWFEPQPELIAFISLIIGETGDRKQGPDHSFNLFPTR